MTMTPTSAEVFEKLETLFSQYAESPDIETETNLRVRIETTIEMLRLKAYAAGVEKGRQIAFDVIESMK
jgi:hypothetical protein